MTRCSWPVNGPRNRLECGHRACEGFVLDGEVLPRCSRHLTQAARSLAAEQGVQLIDLSTVGSAAGKHL